MYTHTHTFSSRLYLLRINKLVESKCQSSRSGLIFIGNTWQPLRRQELGKAQVTEANNVKARTHTHTHTHTHTRTHPHKHTQKKSICLTKHHTFVSLPVCLSDHVNMCLHMCSANNAPMCTRTTQRDDIHNVTAL